MASFQKSQYIDILNIKKLYVKGDNNSNIPINSVLVTDGNGGTDWVDIGLINTGISFNTIITTPSTLVSGIGKTSFSILDGSNAGLLAGTNNTFTMYAKAFGQFDVQGQSSITSFNTYSGTITSNIRLNGTGIIHISTDTRNNLINFDVPNDALSSISTAISNLSSINVSLSSSIQTFTSPFSIFIDRMISSFSTSLGPTVQFLPLYSTLSTFSTSLGPTVQFPQLYSTISTFSTSLGPIVHFPDLYSTFSTFSTSLGPLVQTDQISQLYSTFSSFSTVLGPIVTTNNLSNNLSNAISSQIYTNILNTSSITLLGIQQPIIQYGLLNIPNSGSNIVSISPYINSNYAITTTYTNRRTPPSQPLYIFNPTPSNFVVFGDQGSQFYWTTYGSMF
jgi:hypothetical protein